MITTLFHEKECTIPTLLNMYKVREDRQGCYQKGCEQMEQCIICEEEKKDGIEVWGQFICHDCEQEMVKTDVGDRRYRFFIHRLRKLWIKEKV